MAASASTLRRIAVAIQTVATLATALALHRWAEWPIGVAVAGAAALYIALFAIAVGAAFAITHYGVGVPAACRPRADNVPLPRSIQLPPIALCVCWLRECIAVWWLFNVTQPFFAHRPFDYPPAATPTGTPETGRTPLLLVHGYACNHAVWLGMQRHLIRAGHPCEALDLMPVLGDINDYGRQIAIRATAMRKHHGRPPILVCHSMGGLAARAALHLCRAPDADIPTDLPFAHIVTLGTPHHGTALARYGQGRNAEQMRCGSAWLTALAAAETASERARITSIFSWHDSIVGPRGTTWLEGAHHIPLRGLGHVSLLTHPGVATCILDRLVALEAPHRTVM